MYHGQVVMGKLRVILVEDHPIFREGLRRALEAEADIEVVGEFAHAKPALEQAEQLQPDVLITDINLPGMNGIQLSKALKSFFRSLSNLSIRLLKGVLIRPFKLSKFDLISAAIVSIRVMRSFTAFASL